ncbi:response regulator transcription factor [Curvivirga aplysinae]|uniref:response regulator transcription factor n=1 Tax=Curvivirga aplysinae TaxID=2529852 RepID=UPI001C3F58A2|nr:response regulator [Curvivirga aplysinae]
MAGLSKVGAQKHLNKVNVLYVEDKSSIRTTIRNVLSQEGLTQTRDFMRLEPVRVTLMSEMPDLLILDAEMEDRSGDAIQLIRDIRYGKLGKNPYIPIIATLWSADSHLIGRIVDSGADDILLKPFSPNGLMDRIKALISARKEFIVTSDYIGPDRRKDANRNSSIPSMVVPNTLEAKVKGKEISHLELSRAIASVNNQVNELKMQRNAFQISFVVEMLQPKLIAGEKTQEVEDFIRRLHRSASDTASRLHGTGYEHVSELCETLTTVSLSLLSDLDDPSEKDIKLIKPLSDAILLAFNPDADAEALSSQITGAVSGFQKRQAEKRRLREQQELDKKATEELSAE